MGNRKTERVYGRASLDGDDLATASSSLHMALSDLANNADVDDRDVLFDTLEIEIERDVVSEYTIASALPSITINAIITVHAQAVKR